MMAVIGGIESIAYVGHDTANPEPAFDRPFEILAFSRGLGNLGFQYCSKANPGVLD
jgi:hypothetical protein